MRQYIWNYIGNEESYLPSNKMYIYISSATTSIHIAWKEEDDSLGKYFIKDKVRKK